MKKMIKASFIFLFFIMLLPGTATPDTLPEKYNLDDDLEAIQQISTFEIRYWEKVDNQSIIIRANWKDYYLFVLRRPIDSMFFIHTIAIDSMGPTIISGDSRIVMNDGTVTQYFVIDKIYRIKDWDQVEEIKKRLGKS
jgi:hypothetical protein